MHQQSLSLMNYTVSYISGESTAMSSTSFKKLVEACLSEQLSALRSCQEYPKTRTSNQSTDLASTLTGGTTK